MPHLEFKDLSALGADLSLVGFTKHDLVLLPTGAVALARAALSGI
jgi:hypothetical protein